MITYHGCNNGYNNPVYNANRNVGAHYTWQNTVPLNGGLCLLLGIGGTERT